MSHTRASAHRNGSGVDDAAQAVESAAAHHARQNQTAAHTLTRELADMWPGGQSVVDRAVGAVLRARLAHLWENGWLPTDVHQMAARQRSKLATMLALDAIADQHAEYSTGSIHPLWQRHVDRLDMQRWWDPGQPHLSQWARRHDISRQEALWTAVELIAMFLTMSVLPVIVPPPGREPAFRPVTASGGVDEKVLGKVRALLAKAESTEFAEEAEALSAKAQELMARHSIERGLADAGPLRPPPVASACRVWLDAPYVGAKSLLVAQVASANRCRTVSYEKLGFVTVLGDQIDLDVVELLSTSLMVQATRAMLAADQRIVRSRRSRVRSFRHSFLIAYATRVGERLREVNEESVQSADRQLAPVFADRRRAVDELFDTLFGRRVGSRSFSVGNSDGYGAGRLAADQAVLGGPRRALPRS